MGEFEEAFADQLVEEFDCSRALAEEIAAKATVYHEETGDAWTAADWVELLAESPRESLQDQWNWAVGYRSTMLDMDADRYQL